MALTDGKQSYKRIVFPLQVKDHRNYVQYKLTIINISTIMYIFLFYLASVIYRLLCRTYIPTHNHEIDSEPLVTDSHSTSFIIY